MPKRHINNFGCDLRILYVDKDNGMRALFVRLLEYFGFDGDVASSCEDALRKVRQEPFNLVITEYDLLGTNGRDLAKKIKTIRPTCPVLLLVGSELSLDPEVEKLNGIEAIVVRPTTVNNLHTEILGVLGIKGRLPPAHP